MSNLPNDSNNPRQVFLGPAGLRIRFHLRNADDLTSPPSPPVVPIGRGRGDLRSNDGSSSSLPARGVGRGQTTSSSFNQRGRVSEPIVVNPEGFGIMVRINSNLADDSTSTNNSADELTSPSSNNAVDDSTSSPMFQRIFAERNTSSNSFAGRGVGRGQNISRPFNQTTSASIGREVRRGVGRGGRYSSPYQRPTRSAEEEIEEENYFPAPSNLERSSDGRLASFILDLIDVEGGSPYDLFNRYAEYVLRQRIQTLERERERLRAQYQRLLRHFRQE